MLEKVIPGEKLQRCTSTQDRLLWKDLHKAAGGGLAVSAVHQVWIPHTQKRQLLFLVFREYSTKYINMNAG